MTFHSLLHMWKSKLLFRNKSTSKFLVCFPNPNEWIGIFSQGARILSGPGPFHYWGFTITLRHTTIDGTPLEEWPANRRNLYLRRHNVYKRQTAMTPAGFERAILKSERLQTHALNRAVTGFGSRSTGTVWSVIGTFPWRNTQAK